MTCQDCTALVLTTCPRCRAARKPQWVAACKKQIADLCEAINEAKAAGERYLVREYRQDLQIAMGELEQAEAS